MQTFFYTPELYNDNNLTVTQPDKFKEISTKQFSKHLNRFPGTHKLGSLTLAMKRDYYAVK